MAESNQSLHVVFRVGQVVHHRRYGYRAVIVAYDEYCKAPQTWRTQDHPSPTRNQPWYHLLVHDGEKSYVAQENLELDRSGGPVEHPLTKVLFPTFQDGRYFRQSLN